MTRRISAAVCASLLIGFLAWPPGAEAEEEPLRTPGMAGGWPELSEPAARERSQGVHEKLMLVSWGDLIIFYGPETDAALYNRGQIERMMSSWKRSGFTQVYWRAENLPMPDWKWNQSSIYAEASLIKSEADKIHAAEDTTLSARELAGKMGLKFFFWHSIYDEGTPPDKKHRFWTGFPWRHTYFDDHPGLENVDRKGEVQWGVPEMAYPAVRKRKIHQYLDFVAKYHPDGVLVYLHSHSSPGLDGDQYGFNKIIADEFKKRHGVDILTDPRFDYADPRFDRKDAMVEKWRDLRGEYLTQFLRELGAELRKVDPRVRIAVNTQGGDYFGPPFGNMKIHWRTWIQEGLIDVLIVRTWMAGGCGAYDFRKENYLTWGDGAIGVTPYEEIRNEIERSGNKVQLISRSRNYIPGADGYYDAANRDVASVKSQRQEQLAANLKRHGKIAWIDQDFQSGPLEKTGCLDYRTGSRRYYIGDPRYYASRNRSPGFAGPLTLDPAQSPALVDVSGKGGAGMAACLREKGLGLEITRRTGSSWPDDPISKGKAVVGFDLMRQPGSECGMSLLHDRRGGPGLPAATEQNLQLKIDGKGVLSVWNGKQWSTTGRTVAEGAWTTVCLDVDLESETYGLRIQGQSGASGKIQADKLVFDGLAFACTKGEIHVDNVQTHWSW
ncbi:MAG: hypothetical protein HUU20_03385 [Pirellulales bacterium]|nr:hypothetical protein [Pirellulales bacterium]